MAASASVPRIAVVRADRCKPKKCRRECVKSCPVVQMGKMCIDVTPASKVASISEELCVGCGACVKRCPFNAVRIVKLPAGLASEVAHRHGVNGFQLHRLPVPQPGTVLGLVGVNGIGKSTALTALSGRMRPNLGAVHDPPAWSGVVKHFRGSHLQDYFQAVAGGTMRCAVKPQYVDQIPAHTTETVGAVLRAQNQRGDGARDATTHTLRLTHLLQRDVTELSGGELQRMAIAVTVLRDADVYMFDEPSSFLDVKQRMTAARVIRDVACACPNGADAAAAAAAPRVVCVEHDLALLDYMSDTVCCMYGEPGAYGVVTPPYSVRTGINVFLAGYAPSENVRFRQEELSFKTARVAATAAASADTSPRHAYPAMTRHLHSKTRDNAFVLRVDAGSFVDGEITVMLGQNGTGKSTFLKLLAGRLRADDADGTDGVHGVHGRTVSYKPQAIRPSFRGTVRELVHGALRGAHAAPQFASDVMAPLRMDALMDRTVHTLSGGELQRVALTLCLGKPAELYLIDEPSAYLDSEQRVLAAKVIQRHMRHTRAAAFVVEHDLIMAAYLADRVMTYTGEPGVAATAHTPRDVVDGMHAFLRDLDVTLRRDPETHRPRVNKAGSVQDRAQKASGQYFFTGEA